MSSPSKPTLRILAPHEAFELETRRAAMERRLDAVAGIRRYGRAHLRLVPAGEAQGTGRGFDPYEDGPRAA